MYVERTIADFVKSATRHFPVVLVTGARQVGKTTVLNHLKDEKRIYVTLDDPMIASLAREDPPLFLKRFPGPVLIDEIQYAPELLPYIKIEIDRERKPGSYWITGSQQFHLMKGLSESLAGRVAVVRLLGLSRGELFGRGGPPFLPLAERVSTVDEKNSLTLNELYRLIWRGSFPAVATNDAMDKDLFYGSYIQTYIQRDVRDLARVGDEMDFLRFLRAAAARSGQMLNLADLARDANVAPNTAKSWLSILETSGIVQLLEPYHTNVTKRLVKTPKLYFLDTGLCSYLTQWTTSETLAVGAMSGAMFETWVFGELLKSYLHNGVQAPFFYFRDKDGKEIDLLIVKDGTIYPIEFKRTASPRTDDVRHFHALNKLGLPVGEGGVICLAERSLPLGDSVFSIPVAAL